MSEIDFHYMKYDLSTIKTSILESFYEFKQNQTSIRNYLLLCNKKEKKNREKNNKLKIDKDIYKMRIKTNILLDFSDEEHIPKGYFCYPLKGSYFQKSSLDVPFFPLLPFDKFKEGIETFPDQKNLSETYQSYPCLSKEDYNRIKYKIIQANNKTYNNEIIFKENNSERNNIIVRPSHSTHNINKYFIIWSYIKILKEQLIIMDNEFYEIYKNDKNNIIIPILKEMNKYLRIDINILYYIINNFLNDLSKKINKNSLINRGITSKKYEKYWCRICNRFCCSFHFKVKIKPKFSDKNNIRTNIEYFKKIENIIKPPEYLYKEKNESEENKNELISIIREIIINCPCKNQLENDKIKKEKNIEEYDNSYNNSLKKDNFIFDKSVRFNKMAEISNKEDFFVLCKFLKTCHKIISTNFDSFNNEITKNYLNPCVIRKILHDKYDCNLLKYLIKLITEEEFLQDINLFLTKEFGDNIVYENLKEENYLFFNNSNDINLESKIFKPKGKKDNKAKFQRTKETARLQIQSKKNLYYKPCDHYPSECTKDNCPCAKNGNCYKFCCCYKEENRKYSCNFMFSGCRHHTHNNEICRDCTCQKNNIECIPGFCNCDDKCINNSITLGKRKKLLFGFSEKIKGGGLFAGEKILMGEFIDNYDGEIGEKDELDRLSVFYDQTGNNYPFNINSKLDFITIKCGGITRYINHGSFGEENVKADEMMVNGNPYIAFYALRDIEKYEELLYDYSYDKNSMPEWNKKYNEMMKERKKKEKRRIEETQKFYENPNRQFQQKRKKRDKKNKKENEISYSSNMIKLEEGDDND